MKTTAYPLVCAMLLLAGCSSGSEDANQSAVPPAAKTPEATDQELLNTVKPAMEKAKSVEQTLQNAEDARQRQMDDQGQ